MYREPAQQNSLVIRAMNNGNVNSEAPCELTVWVKHRGCAIAFRALNVVKRGLDTDIFSSLFVSFVRVFLSWSASLLLCRTFAAHVIVQFTLRLLDEELSSLRGSDVSHSLCGAFIFVCRQIYNTCEGLQVLRPYGLHKAVAAAWKKVPAWSFPTENWSSFLFGLGFPLDLECLKSSVF